jgi:hypothetical protein
LKPSQTLAPPLATHQVTHTATLPIPNPRSLAPTPINIVTSLPQSRTLNRFRASIKIFQIHADRAKGVIACYRYGEKDHTSRECRNSIVSFECGRLGRRSVNFRAITLLPTQPKPKSDLAISAKTISQHTQPNITPPAAQKHMENYNKADKYALL